MKDGKEKLVPSTEQRKDKEIPFRESNHEVAHTTRDHGAKNSTVQSVMPPPTKPTRK